MRVARERTGRGTRAAGIFAVGHRRRFREGGRQEVREKGRKGEGVRVVVGLFVGFFVNFFVVTGTVVTCIQGRGKAREYGSTKRRWSW